MASSRSTRKSSRNATPDSAPSHHLPVTGFNTFHQKANGNTVEEWPDKSASPGPNAQRSPGIEQFRALPHTASAGTTTGPKLKLRVKQYDPTPRLAKTTKNGDSHTLRATPKNPDPSSASRHSDMKSTDIAFSAKQPAKAALAYRDDAPTGRAADESPASNSLSQLAPPTPKVSTPGGEGYLHQVVESAVHRARDLGNETLGLAIYRLYEDSRQNSALAELLEAVLSQRPSPQQAREFQAYIRSVRKQIKMESIAAQASTKPASTSELRESAKSRPRVTRRSRSRNLASSSEPGPITTPRPAKHPLNGDMDGTSPLSDEPPAKRSKRSDRASSTSSLSSTHSLDLETDDLPAIDGSGSAVTGPKLRSGLGPKPPNLLGKQTTGTKRAGGALVGPNGKGDRDDAGIAELAVKKRKLARTFDDLKVEPSDIRNPPRPTHSSPAITRHVAAFDTASAPRLSKAQDLEDIRSPASSAQGDFLIPPPPGALRSSRSRGATPVALGRPRTTVKRSARVKMS